MPTEMAKNVIVLASGETERRALPHLLSHLRARGIFVKEVLIPPRNRALSVRMAVRLVKAAWYKDLDASPDKFVILLDVDGKPPVRVLEPYGALPERLGDEIGAEILYAYAQWHLEAWYFADEANLRDCLGRTLGNVDTSKPDGIQNPKLHLKHLLGNRIYTARISEEIAIRLDAQTIAERSPSFRGFLNAVVNGSCRGSAS